jgi:hypothetical protein
MKYITFLPSRNSILQEVTKRLNLKAFNPESFSLPSNGRFTKSADGLHENCYATYADEKKQIVQGSRCMVFTPPVKVYGINHKKKGQGGAMAPDDPEKMELNVLFSTNGDDDEAKQVVKQLDEVVFQYCSKNKATLLRPERKNACDAVLQEFFHGLCSYKMTDMGKDVENPKLKLNVPYDVSTDRINVVIRDLEMEEDEDGQTNIYLSEPIYDPDSADPAMVRMRKADVQALVDPDRFQIMVGFVCSGLWQTGIGFGVNKKVTELWRVPVRTMDVNEALKTMMRSKKRPSTGEEPAGKKTTRGGAEESSLLQQLESETKAVAEAAAMPVAAKSRDDVEAAALLKQLESEPLAESAASTTAAAAAAPPTTAAAAAPTKPGGPKPPVRSAPKPGPAK